MADKKRYPGPPQESALSAVVVEYLKSILQLISNHQNKIICDQSVYKQLATN